VRTRGLAPTGTVVAALRGPGGVAIDDSSALHLPSPALVAPCRARDIASDVLFTGSPRTAQPREWLTRSASLRADAVRHVPFGIAPSRQRLARVVGQDAFRRPSCSLPLSRRRFRACAWDHEEPATGLAARALVALATANPRTTPLHPLRSHASRLACQRARPLAFRPWTERRSSTSAITTTREHHRSDRPTPARSFGRTRRRALARSTVLLSRRPGSAASSAPRAGSETRHAARRHRPRFHG